MKDWEIYQRLAADIYAELDPSASVKHDDRILGVNTGIFRQIDVSIRSVIATHEILIIVQAKDIQEPADVNVVGEFKAVIDDVRASKGILVCSNGFTKAAQEYAQRLNIDLCRLVDAESRKWGIDLTIPLVWVENPVEVRANLELRADRNNEEALVLHPNVARWKISKDFGATGETIGELFAHRWNARQISHTPHVWHKYVVEDSELRVLLGDKDFWCPFTLEIEYLCDRKAWLGSFPLKTIKGILNHSKNTLKARVSISPSELPNTRSDNWTRLEDPDSFFSSQPAVMQAELEDLDPSSMEMQWLGFSAAD